MKSSGNFQNDPVKVARAASDYTTEEQARFREAFQPAAARYRRRGRMSYGVVAVGLACLVLGFILPGHAGGRAGGVFLLCWLVLMAFTFFPVRLACPGCSNDMERGDPGPYCPACGSRSLSLGGRIGAPRCAACGKRIRRGRRRFHKVRACTQCGLMLDERGL